MSPFEQADEYRIKKQVYRNYLLVSSSGYIPILQKGNCVCSFLYIYIYIYLYTLT